eukprot:TRINITY_DN803_c0_g4_i1.p1 TRINITY_DN803_c0_g4~~TRINITY_DN803_c0_g4_i1.p1  ORF type:complete len:284 (+),score=46.02 TRINITY_DN803_c0_g4_i1:27-854(+)
MVRLAAEYRLLTAKPLPSIRVSLPNEDDLFVWHAVLAGPPGTPWEGGSYPLEVHLSPSYPRKPPDSVRFLTEVFHPNVAQDGVPYLDFLAVQSVKPGSSATREELVGARKEGAREPGKETRALNGATTSAGVQSHGPASRGLQERPKETERTSGEVKATTAGEEVGEAESRTADEIVVAAERLLSVASLNAESELADGCLETRDGGSGAYDGEGQRGRHWDPYQGLSFVLKSVQQLLWDVNLENVVNEEAAALFREDRTAWERRARRSAQGSQTI